MRRFIHLIAVAIVVAMMVLSAGSAFAQSCFDNYNTLTQGPQDPVGREISGTATGAAVPSEPQSGTDRLARTVGLLTKAKQLCP
jgi:hypothetical protein